MFARFVVIAFRFFLSGGRQSLWTLVAAGGLAALASGALAAEVERPNIVLIFADDKYEYRAHEAQNLRKNRENTVFSVRYQIAGNCSDFRGIAGD